MVFLQDQIKQYIQEYDQHSQLDSERKRCVRAPKPFIGRVMRVPLSTTDFCTLDRVDIFYLEPVPLWCPLRYCRSLVFLTTWNSDSGELITMSLITNKEKFKHWESRQRLQHVSYLYCQPGPIQFIFTSSKNKIQTNFYIQTWILSFRFVLTWNPFVLLVFQRKYEFHYWADREKHEVYYSHVPFTYSKFIPESLLQKLQNSTNFCDIDDCCPIWTFSSFFVFSVWYFLFIYSHTKIKLCIKLKTRMSCFVCNQSIASCIHFQINCKLILFNNKSVFSSCVLTARLCVELTFITSSWRKVLFCFFVLSV